jgi:hypothetical protein
MVISMGVKRKFVRVTENDWPPPWPWTEPGPEKDAADTGAPFPAGTTDVMHAQQQTAPPFRGHPFRLSDAEPEPGGVGARTSARAEVGAHPRKQNKPSVASHGFVNGRVVINLSF